jgi:endonuclease YncB( thermonuclease family)
MYRKSLSYLASLTLIASGMAVAADGHLPGRVLRVIDGDRLVVDVSGAHYQVSLRGIDAPELNQPWGDTAAAQLRRTLGGAFVVIALEQPDRRRPLIGSVQHKGRDVAADLLYDGLAWSTIAAPSTPYEAEHRYRLLQHEAREARRGLWSDSQPIAPWDWRRQSWPASSTPPD